MIYDVYLSYSRQDRDFAARLASALEAAGFRVFRDVEIPPGADWSNLIHEQIDAAKVMIVLWSTSSAQSQWVRAEAQLAADRDKFLPVFIERIKLPLGFSQYHTLDLSGWDGSSADPKLVQLLSHVAKSTGTFISPHARADTSSVRPGAKEPFDLSRKYRKTKRASSIGVFVAHASADKPLLAPMIMALVDQGFRLWIDKPQRIGLAASYEAKIALDRINYGNDWKEDIRKAIKRADVVLAFWSKDAVKGRREQFHYEVYQGMMQRKLNQCRIDTVEFDEIGMPYTFDHIADLVEMVPDQYHPEMDYLMQDIVKRRRTWRVWST